MRVNFFSYYPHGITRNIPERIEKAPGEINIYSDYHITQKYGYYGKNAIAILVEPRVIIPEVYAFVEEHSNNFKYIFTHDDKILNKCSNAKLLIYGQITAEYPDPEKTKDISMVCSNKTFCEGHRQRNEIAKALKGVTDTYGQFDGGAFCDFKDFLEGYRFNVAMENCSIGYYFSEKLCNCFASRIIPIYWGCPNIGEYFDTSGMILLEDYKNIPMVVKALKEYGIEKAYEEKKEAIERNFKEVQKYRCYGIWFFNNYSQLLEDLANES